MSTQRHQIFDVAIHAISDSKYSHVSCPRKKGKNYEDVTIDILREVNSTPAISTVIVRIGDDYELLRMDLNYNTVGKYHSIRGLESVVVDSPEFSEIITF